MWLNGYTHDLQVLFESKSIEVEQYNMIALIAI